MPLLLRTLVLAVATSALVGCSSTSQSNIRLTSTASGQPFTQSFPEGVADVRDAGDADVVVACRTDPATAGTAAVRQVLHVRVLWQQGYTVKAQQRDVSQNAALHWYVYPAGRGDGVGGQPQVVEYTGTGLVEMTRDGDRVAVKVIQASVRPTTVAGGMTDPVGPATLTGTLVARQDRPEAAALLTDLRATVAAARREPGSAEARVPLGQ